MTRRENKIINSDSLSLCGATVKIKFAAQSFVSFYLFVHSFNSFVLFSRGTAEIAKRNFYTTPVHFARYLDTIYWDFRNKNVVS